MRRLVAAFVALALATAPAFAQTSKTKAVVTTEIGQDFPDNSTGAITPAGVRSFLTDVVNSYGQWPLVNTQTGTSYTALTADMGALINVSANSTFTLTLPAPASLPTGWSAFIKNSSASASTTISPQSGTIGGSATLALAATQGTFVVSDGANWQTWGGFGVGTVASVGLSLPNIFNVNGSPVTGSGTITAGLATENANTALMGPLSGAAASPTFRALASNDMPTPNATSLGAVYSTNAFAHQFITSINNSGTPQQAVPSVADLQMVTPNSYLGNPTGAQATPQAGTLGRTADWNQNTQNDVVMVVDQLRLAASPQFVTANGSITLNFANGMNFNTTLNTTCNPCTVVTPQSLSQTWAGSLIITNASQNASIAFSKPIWTFAGGTAPTASVTNNDVDILNFICVTPNAKCYAFYGGNYQ